VELIRRLLSLLCAVVLGGKFGEEAESAVWARDYNDTTLDIDKTPFIESSTIE
jgi:hypothetical protein